MKNVIFLFALLLSFGNTYSQKKKAPQKSATSVIAKADNLTAELIKNNFYLFVNNKGAKKDTIFTKTTDAKTIPTECKIAPFTAKGVPLYYISWVEKNITKTDLKMEEATRINSEIWDVTTKTKLLSNVQGTTKIVEKVFLDKLKNASETQERMRREGYEFILTKEGDVIMKNKTLESKLTYDPTNKKFVDAKKKK
ncbi:MAG: hypothetical protein ABWZ56_08935 [Flavobacterium sp.]